MFENLSDRLERSFKILKGEGKITEVNVAETIKEIRRALLDADVSYKVAKTFCDRVKDKAMGADVLTAVKPQQMMVKIVHDELAEFMGSEHSEINVKGSPAIVLVAGLNGSMQGGRALVVNEARPREERPRGERRGFGGPRGERHGGFGAPRNDRRGGFSAPREEEF